MRLFLAALGLAALVALVRWLCRCRHEHRYLKVRRVGRRDVLFLVCDRCFHEVRALKRSRGDARSSAVLSHPTARLKKKPADLYLMPTRPGQADAPRTRVR